MTSLLPPATEGPTREATAASARQQQRRGANEEGRLGRQRLGGDGGMSRRRAADVQEVTDRTEAASSAGGERGRGRGGMKGQRGSRSSGHNPRVGKGVRASSTGRDGGMTGELASGSPFAALSVGRQKNQAAAGEGQRREKRGR